MKLSTNMLALKEHLIDQINCSFDQIVEDQLDCNPEVCSAALVSGVAKCIDQTLNEAARSGLEQFIQSFETNPSKTLEAEGKQWRFNKISSRSFLTIFGRITLQRALYYPVSRDEPDDPQSESNKHTYIPLDQAWGMAERTVTPEVTEAVLFACTSMENKEVSQLLGKVAHFGLSTSNIYQLRLEHGKAIHDWTQTEEGLQARLEATDISTQTKALVAGLDGANVPLREPGAARGRPQEKPSFTKKRQSGGDLKGTPKNSCYKNAMVGSLSLYGTGEIVDFKTGETTIDSYRLNSVYTAQMPEERFGTFKKEYEMTLDNLESRLPEDVVKVLLLDGGKPLWGYLHDNAERFKDYEKLLDYYHATEHLSLAAEAIYGKQSPEAQRWYENWLTKLKNEDGGVMALLRSLQYHRRKTRLPRSRAEELRKQEGFFKRNAKYMNYASFVARNLPIGSGPTEAACKTIVKQRMCRSGMRWDREKGQAVLTIRAVAKSGQWDEVWQSYHKNCWDLAA